VSYFFCKKNLRNIKLNWYDIRTTDESDEKQCEDKEVRIATRKTTSEHSDEKKQ